MREQTGRQSGAQQSLRKLPLRPNVWRTVRRWMMSAMSGKAWKAWKKNEAP